MVLPARPDAELHATFDPLMRYLERALDIPVVLSIAPTYPELQRRFRRGEVDVVFVGALNYAIARRFSGAVPLAIRDVDERLTTSFIARAHDSARTIADFRGRRLRFGNHLSTSAHLMARHYLASRGIDPDRSFAEVRHSSTQDETVAAVLHGAADLGAVSTSLLDRVFEEDPSLRRQLRVVEVTPPFADNVWAARAGLDAGVRLRLQLALFKLSPHDSGAAAILAAQRAGGYLPVDEAGFGAVEEIASRLGLLKFPE